MGIEGVVPPSYCAPPPTICSLPLYSCLQMNVGIKGVVPGEPTEQHILQKLLKCKFWGGLALGCLAVVAYLFDLVCQVEGIRQGREGQGGTLVLGVASSKAQGIHLGVAPPSVGCGVTVWGVGLTPGRFAHFFTHFPPISLSCLHSPSLAPRWPPRACSSSWVR